MRYDNMADFLSALEELYKAMRDIGIELDGIYKNVVEEDTFDIYLPEDELDRFLYQYIRNK